MIVPLKPPPPPQHPSLSKDNSMIDKKKAVDESYLLDWYISSVMDDEPVWTEKHIEELCHDFYVIPKDTLKVGEWVPCSKELPHFGPEKQRSVLVTMEDSDGMRFVTSAKYQEERCEWCNFKDPRYYNFEVIAWQLKPEPWEGEK